MPDSSQLRSKTLPPPLMGWNTKDPISEMDPLYSPEVVNYYSNGGSVDLREGTSAYANSISTVEVVFLASFSSSVGVDKMIATGLNQRTYNISSSGAGSDLSNGGTRLVDPFSANSVNFKNQIFIGDSQAATIWRWDGAAAAIVDSALVVTGNCYALGTYKSRIYVSTSQSIWYVAGAGGIAAITGAMTEFALTSLFQKNGYIVFADGVNRAGQIDSEYFVIITNMGEVLVYQGNNPGDSTWALIGHYFAPPLVGPGAYGYSNPIIKLTGDLLLITYQGVLLLSEVMRGASSLIFLSDKISDQFGSNLFDNSSGDPYWVTGTALPFKNLVIMSFWYDAGANFSSPMQYVLNITTGAWWKWTISNMFSLATLGSSDKYLYFGTSNGKVMKYGGTYADISPSTGSVVSRSTTLRFAYNYMDNPETVKIPVQARPIIYESEGLSITCDANVDFENIVATSTNSNTADTSYKLYKPTVGLCNIPGKAISIRFDGSVTTKKRSIQAVEVFWKEGGVRA